jgi:hypothetical protein
MGGGHAESCMEPQQNSLQSHQFYSILAVVWSRGSITQRNQISKFAHNSGGITMPHEAEEKDLLESERLKAVTNL